MSTRRVIAIATVLGALLGAAHLAGMVCPNLTECAVLGDGSLFLPQWRPDAGI